MNFQFMPELGWRYGYEATVGGMALLCGALWVGFKRSGWL
jgi:magnesium transporter